MDEFLVRALAAGVGLAAFAGPLGCFVVWRRMAYFGDTLAHSALLGIALGLLLGIEPAVGIVASCVAVALLLTAATNRQRRLSRDTVLGILAHGSLSLGLIAIAAQPEVRVDLMGYLFGDILAVTWTDVLRIYAFGLVALGFFAWIWRPLLMVTLHEDLARVEGLPVLRVQLGFILAMALVVALAMKLVGILLVTSMLIVPAAAARRLARSPSAMAGFASLAGMAAVAGGLGASLRWDLPSGPAIVAAAIALLVLSLALPGRLTKS